MQFAVLTIMHLRLFNIDKIKEPQIFTSTIFVACPFKPADIIFVLDGSGSEGSQNFQRQLNFVSNFTKQFQIGPNNTRVALVSFGTSVHNEFFLNQYTDNVTLLNHIEHAKYPDGETNTHLGK